MDTSLDKINAVLKGNRHTYRIKSVLGQGGFGITYLASAREGGTVYLYAVKEHFIKDTCDRAADGSVTCSQAASQRVNESMGDFLREAQRLESLRNGNSSIVRVADIFEFNNTAYYAMEYLDGGSLRCKVLLQGVMDEAEMLQEMKPIVEAVQYLHDNHMLHLDIKPDNIVLRLEDDGSETPVLVDFGVAMHFDNKGNATTSSRFVGGTKGYAPLEQAQGITTFTPLPDVYALGATMYFLLTGKDPAQADFDTAERVDEQLLTIGVSKYVRQAIVHAMMPNPQERTSSARQLLVELTDYNSQLVYTEDVGKENAHISTDINATTYVATEIMSEEVKQEDDEKSSMDINATTLVATEVLSKEVKQVGDKKSSDLKSKLQNIQDTPNPPVSWWKKNFWIFIIVAVVTMVLVFLLSTEKRKNESGGISSIEEKEKDMPATQVITANGVDFNMVWVAGGTFTMGATSEQEVEAERDEKPTHSVTLSGYYMGETEVTQKQWVAVMGSEPTEEGGWSNYRGYGANYPAYKVSYNDIQIFIHKLNQITGRTFRLPTEAEWEYAARGGNQSRGYRYSGSNKLDDVAWYDCNSDKIAHIVKLKQPNELGLYDMSGNVCEWCSDWYGSYGIQPQTDPQGPSTGDLKVLRGGGCYYSAQGCKLSYRFSSSPNSCRSIYGFRLVLCP